MLKIPLHSYETKIYTKKHLSYLGTGQFLVSIMFLFIIEVWTNATLRENEINSI